MQGKRAHKAMKRLLARIQTPEVCTPTGPELLHGRSGGTTARLNKAWETASRCADLPAYTFHHCRHIAASILAQSGASVVTIMQALNHKTPIVAMRCSHLNTDVLRESLGRAWK